MPEDVACKGSERPIQFGVGTLGGSAWSTYTSGAYLAYLGYSFAIGIVVMAIAVWVFGRSEANFAEEL